MAQAVAVPRLPSNPPPHHNKHTTPTSHLDNCLPHCVVIHSEKYTRYPPHSGALSYYQRHLNPESVQDLNTKHFFHVLFLGLFKHISHYYEQKVFQLHTWHWDADANYKWRILKWSEIYLKSKEMYVKYKYLLNISTTM